MLLYYQNMHAYFALPMGEFPQDTRLPLLDDLGSNWASLEKALETYGQTIMHCTRHKIRDPKNSRPEKWEASKYDTGSPPDMTKIPIKSPFRPGLSEEKINDVAQILQRWLKV